MQSLGGALRRASLAHHCKLPTGCVRFSSKLVDDADEPVTTVGSQDTTLQGHGDPMVQQRAVGATDEQEMSIYKKDVNRVRGVYAPRFVAERQQKLDEKARRKAEAGLILERALTVPLVPRDMQRASEKTLALEQEDPEAEAALSPVEREKLNYWRKIKKMRRLAVEAKETAVKEQRAIDRETAIKRKEEWNRRSYKLIRQAELHSTFWQTDMSQLVNSPAFWNNGAALHTDEEFFGKEKASQFSEQEHMQDTQSIMESIRSSRPKYYMDTDDLDLYSLVGQDGESGTQGLDVGGKHEGDVFGETTDTISLDGDASMRMDNAAQKEEMQKLVQEMEANGFNPIHLTMLKDKSLSLEDVDGEFFATYFMDFDQMAEDAGLDDTTTQSKEDVQQMVKEFNRTTRLRERV